MHFLLKLALLVLVFIPMLSAEDFPITMAYRKAITGSGYVIMMKNTSDGSVRVKVKALDKAAEKVVDPGSVWELGHKEGFTFAVSDKVSVTVGDKTIEKVIVVEPISVAHRKALLDSSLVLMIERSGKDVVKTIQVVCERPANGDKKTVSLTFGDNSNSIELGHKEGWAFQKGDKATISGEGITTLIRVME
jgi:hypothetical protein